MAFIANMTRLGAQFGVAVIRGPVGRAKPQLMGWRNFSKSNYLAAERRYTEEHEWVSVEGSTGTVGVSHYAQEVLGDIVFAQLPDVGDVLTQNDECGALESVKAASEIFTPISGKVIEKNTEVESTPALVNTNCYDKGWLFKVTLSDPAEFEKLMSEEDYSEFLKSADH